MNSDDDLTSHAARHATRLQWAAAAVALSVFCLSQLTYPLSKAASEALGLSDDRFLVIQLIVVGGLLSLLTSWSAVWIVLGSGRWLGRLAITLAIDHVLIVCAIAVASGIEAFREGNTSDLRWREWLALFAGSSYALAIQLLVSMGVIWLLKLLRFRLVHFQDTAAYPHPRQAGRGIPLAERIGTTVLASRVLLADLFALTTLVAIYLAAWYPLVEIALREDRMFGANFAFVVILAFLLFNAAIGIPAVLLPLLLAMLDRHGARFQIPAQSAVLLFACLALAIAWWMQSVEDQGVIAAAAGIATLVAYQGLLWMALHKPAPWFRFRLIRYTVARSTPAAGAPRDHAHP
jgi:hypothetical protein